jgi:hypothetical protein
MGRRTRFAVAAVGAAALALPGSAAGQGTKPVITSLGQEALSVKAKTGEDTATTYLSVLNAGDKAAGITVQFQASSSADVRVSGFTPKAAVPGAATRVAVTLSGMKKLKKDAVDGQLVVTGGAAPVARAVSITPAPQPSRNWPLTIFWLTVGVFAGLAVVVAVWARIKGKGGYLGKLAPGPKWSFTSWATTLTAVGALLGTVLGSITLPEVPRQIDKDTLVKLNLLFALLLVIGPFVFQAIRRPSVSASDQEAAYWGWNFSLLGACAITGAAVVGEVVTLGLLGWEVTNGGTWGKLVVVATCVVVVLSLWYFLVTAYDLVTTDWQHEAKKAARAAAKPQKVVIVQPGTRGRRLLNFNVSPVETRGGDGAPLAELLEADVADTVTPDDIVSAQAPQQSWPLP